MHAAHQQLRIAIIACVLCLGYSRCDFFKFDDYIAIPLAFKSPYLSCWRDEPYSTPIKTNLKDEPKGLLTLHAKINDTIYEVSPLGENAEQTGLKITPTQSIFNITIGPVIITYNFFTPIDANDLKRLSLPVSYIAVSAQSTDNQTHPVKIFLGWGLRWSDSLGADTSCNIQQLGPLLDLSLERMKQSRFHQFQDASFLGTFHVFTNNYGSTFGIRRDYLRKVNFTIEGQLQDSMDDFISLIEYTKPVMGISKEIYASPSPSPNVFFGMSRVLKPAINTTDGPMNQLWEDFFNGDEKEMINFAFEDAEDALARCKALDAKILADAEQHGGRNYSLLVSLALRQAFGGIEFIGNQSNPKAFIKDKGTDIICHSRCQRVDPIYPIMPFHLHLNPKILKYLLEPLLVYQESGHSAKPWAISHLGLGYPRCIGGSDRSMDVEQGGNMIIMIDAYVRASNDTDFAMKHYAICKKWAEYLVSNGLYPEKERTSDDLWGPKVNSTNPSLKAAIGIGAMADIAIRVNNIADYSRYRSIAENYTAQWIRLSHDLEKMQTKLRFNDKTDESWALLYNIYTDLLLDTNLIPKEIITQQQLWYITNLKRFGIPLQNDTRISRVDWLLFTAASSRFKFLRKLTYDQLIIYFSHKTAGFSGHIDVLIGGEVIYFKRSRVDVVFAPLTTLTSMNTSFCESDLSD